LHSDKSIEFAKQIRSTSRKSERHAFVEKGESLSKEFSRHALPLTELNAVVEALERANVDYSSGEAERASAIQEFESRMKEAMGYLQRLDAIVEMTLSDNRTAIASWMVARAVSRTVARKRDVQPPAPVNPPAPDPSVPVPTLVPVAESAAA